MVMCLLGAALIAEGGTEVGTERKTCVADDGVQIVYSVTGSGRIGLVFVHGGLADRRFWDHELRSFADQYRVVAPDLAGHGESGVNRKKWSIAAFGNDVRGVIEAEHLEKVVIFGNSLGGPVAIEAARQLPGRVLGVVGIDTFQSLSYRMSADQAASQAEAFRADYAGSLRAMVRQLFHSDADPSVVADAEARMARTAPAVAYEMFMSFAGYTPAESARDLTVPLRAINGDLYPTDVDGVRKIKRDFEVIVMPHMGHYPMLERPEEFDERVIEVLRGLPTTSGKQREQKPQ